MVGKKALAFDASTHLGRKTGIMRSTVNKYESETNVALTPWMSAVKPDPIISSQ